MRRPKPRLLEELGHQSSRSVGRLSDQNLKTLHQFLLVLLIHVRQCLRQRGMGDEIKTELMHNGVEL